MAKLLPDRRTRAGKTAVAGILCAGALILSYLESFLPLTFVTGVPGVRLGFANIAVIVALYCLGPAEAAAVSSLRIFVSALLFGSPTSLIFSLFGGILSFAVLLATKPFEGKFVSLCGISMLAAGAHNFGQICAAALVMKDGAVFSYLPFLLIASIVCGLVTGAVSDVLKNRIIKVTEAKEE